ncbi:MAG: hypothetical protein IKG23_06985 [Clostridia bacterium]|nr:hypothetical protein [Clostridia bacterium]
MKAKRLTAWLATLLLCAAIPFSATADVTARNTEENGKLKETVWVDENGQPAVGPDGYYAVRYTYKQNDVIEKYYDADGKPFRVYGGYYGRRIQKDKHGITEIEYLDENGNTTLNRQGYGMVKMKYFGFGALNSVFYYNQYKKKTVVPELGYASIIYEYSHYTMTSKVYRDEKDNPVEISDGYAQIKMKTDKRYRVLSTRFDHANGKQATNPDGWFRCVKERDDKGRLISVKYYDESERMIDRGAGYAWEGYTYEGENIVKVTRYDLNDKVVTDSNGIATTVREMKDDRIVKESYLDSDGNRINNGLGVGAVKYSYDLQGAVEKVTFLDTEGNAARCSEGYAGYRDTKDESGVTVSRTFLGVDGTPAETAGGYSEIQYVYDETKALTLKKYFDLSGKQVKAE